MGSTGERSAASSITDTNQSPATELFSLSGTIWMIARHRIHQILRRIRPNAFSHTRRMEIIFYLQRMMFMCFGASAVPVGSVAIRTYLPSGDIDMTVMINPLISEEQLAASIYDVLVSEGRNPYVQIRGVVIISARVRIIKCNINNISVDISFNQYAGISAIYYLEEFNHIVGQGDLFKNSVLLVKAWCCYEAEVHGARNGLLSTYAINAMVMHIFTRFPDSRLEPLPVLYKFLEYYSTFDWQNYAVGIRSPTPLTALAEIPGVVYAAEGLVGSQNVVSRHTALEEWALPFPIKHMNIVDPLKHNNNLGRSVTRRNRVIIVSAFARGAARLREILLNQPVDQMRHGLNDFFSNTISWNH